MENVRIIFDNPDGTMGIIVPVADCGLTIDEIAAKDVPAGAPYQIVSSSNLPVDRTFRAAWRRIDEFSVRVDLEASKAVYRNKVRQFRAPLLAALDVEYSKAVEKGLPTDAIVAKKNTLRDAPASDLIANCQTVEELKVLRLPGLEGMVL